MSKKKIIVNISKVGNISQIAVEGTQGDECLTLTEGIKNKSRSTGITEQVRTTEEYHMTAGEGAKEKEKAEMNWSN